MPTQALPPRQPLDLQEREDSTDDLQDALGSVLGVAANVFIDRPGFVASDDEVDPLSAAVRGLTRLNCRRWAASDKSGFSPRVNNYNASVCDPYLESLDENPEGGEIGPEFSGGQCAVVYRVKGEIELFPFSDCSSFGPGAFDIGLSGPILGLVYRVENPSGDLCTPGGNNVYVRHGNPPVESLLGGAGYGVKVTGFNVVREDGLPDNCGSPVPTYQPPATVTPDTPAPPGIVVNLPGLGDVTVNITLGPTGDPIFQLPDIGVDFGIELGGGDDDDDGGGGGGGGGVPPGYQGQPGDPVDVGPGEAADETDPDRNLIGVLVQTIETPARANQVFNFTETYTKGSYFVYFGGEGGLSLNPEGAIARQDQFYYAPEGANRFRVVPNNGFTIRVTPFYEALE